MSEPTTLDRSALSADRVSESWNCTRSVLEAKGGIVAAQNMHAAQAGAEILHAGGNAIDAAVATAYALGVVEPWMCGIGGSGLMVAWLAQKRCAVALDFQGTLPTRLSLDDYPIDPAAPPTPLGFPAVFGDAHRVGYTAITAPGAVAGLEQALDHFGTLPRATILAPAQYLAQQGMIVDWFTTLQISLAATILARDPVSAAIYLPHGAPLLPGQRLIIPHLAETIGEIARDGSASFYRGALAEAITIDLAAGGSRLRQDDFADYQAYRREASIIHHRGYTLYGGGPASGANGLRIMLEASAASMPAPPPQPTPESWLAYATALDATTQYHRRRRDGNSEAGSCTSSLAVVDAHGSMVALTYTLLDRFGSGVTLPKTGILMNNAVGYFDPRPHKPATLTGGQRIAMSHMCPIIAVHNDQPRFAVGASGGDLITPAVAQLVALMIDFNLSLEAALHHPRIDVGEQRALRADPRLGEAVLTALQQYSTCGTVEIAPALVFPKHYGSLTAIARDPATGLNQGGSDPLNPRAGAIAAPI